VRLGMARKLRAARACTSTAKGLPSTAPPGPRRADGIAVLEEEGGGVVHHERPAASMRRTSTPGPGEAVLEHSVMRNCGGGRPPGKHGGPPCAQELGPGDLAVLGHVAHQHQHRPALLAASTRAEGTARPGSRCRAVHSAASVAMVCTESATPGPAAARRRGPGRPGLLGRWCRRTGTPQAGQALGPARELGPGPSRIRRPRSALAGQVAAQWRRSVDLPMPGSPARSTAWPGVRPRPGPRQGRIPWTGRRTPGQGEAREGARPRRRRDGDGRRRPEAGRPPPPGCSVPAAGH
jgi:hypothetical protein